PLPLMTQWGKRNPWVLARPDQLRPGPPPSLKSETWAHDFNEIKTLGAKNSAARTAEQTAAAKFWEASAPAIYFGIVRSFAAAPGRDVAENARLYAAVAMAMDDALVAVMDAKYTYKFWRPITAIRNADRTQNRATEGDPGWLPFIDTPPHPEYPCAPCSAVSPGRGRRQRPLRAHRAAWRARLACPAASTCCLRCTCRARSLGSGKPSAGCERCW